METELLMIENNLKYTLAGLMFVLYAIESPLSNTLKRASKDGSKSLLLRFFESSTALFIMVSHIILPLTLVFTSAISLFYFKDMFIVSIFSVIAIAMYVRAYKTSKEALQGFKAVLAN